MAHAYVDHYGSPEEAIAALNRRRHVKTAAVLAGLIVAIGVTIAAVAAMYSGGPTGVRSIPAAPR